MSEETVGYREDRVLLEASRILDPQFAGVGIYLTGAQVEMLRNVVMYLGRRTMYVDTYYYGHYTMPDDSDWDTILAIVNELEGKLMGGDNALWGYNARWTRSLDVLAGSGGPQIVATAPVGAGKVLVLEAVSWKNNTGVRGTMIFRVVSGSIITELAWEGIPAQYEPLTWKGRVVLAEGDYFQAWQGSCLEDDYNAGAARGYEMIVPD